MQNPELSQKIIDVCDLPSLSLFNTQNITYSVFRSNQNPKPDESRNRPTHTGAGRLSVNSVKS